ncbi:MAG: hypothetical protein J6S14_11120 [Clostridia bacterium]|nr:hypothetical protein [Clostridia bacterium]
MANRGIALSTAGVTIGYAVEATAGERPSSGYALIPDIKEIPDFNPEPETHEATDLEETEYKFYVQGLKDIGGALGFKANFTEKLQGIWEEVVEAHKTNIESGKRVWFEIKHPKLAKSVFFPGEPAAMGLPGMSVNGVLETTVYITPSGAPEWNTKTTA